MSKGFIKLNREAEKLLETDPDAFLLMCQVAFRAKWKDQKLDMSKTKIGEALIGDFESCGLTRQRYRSAQRRLTDRKVLVVQATNKGTIAKLVDNSFCDLNLDISNQQDNQPANQQITIQQPSSNQQITTNKEVKKIDMEEEQTTSAASRPMVIDALRSKGIDSTYDVSLFKSNSAQTVLLALQYIFSPGYVIETTPIQALRWACKEKPWTWKTNQPKPTANRQWVEEFFQDGKTYNGALCEINAEGIFFHRGMKHSPSLKFEDKTFRNNFAKAIEKMDIENPRQPKIENIKQA